MNYKKDFPLLANSASLVYLDSAATAQKPAHVIDGMKYFLEHDYASIHRGSYELSERVEEIYDASKVVFAKLIGAKKENIVYTYNATYAFNILVQSLVLSKKLQSGDKILLGIGEHHANIVPRQIASKLEGIEIERVNIDENYDIDVVDFKKKYTNQVKIVSLSAASNVTGKIYDVKKISSLLRDDTLFIIDASQALPHFALDVEAIQCDALIATGHKMMADTGLGIMYIRNDLLHSLTPTIGGGGSIEEVSSNNYTLKETADKFEPGTPHIIGALSLLKAIEYMDSIGGYEAIQQHEKELMSYALNKFHGLGTSVTLIGPKDIEGRIGIFSFVVPSHPNHIQLGEKLAQRGICVRSGAHCTHPFFEHIEKSGSCRMSLYLYNTKEDIDLFFTALEEIIAA